MNTISLSISKRIAELAPEWNDTQFHYRPHKNSGGSVDYLVQYRMGNYQSILGDVYPAYTLGELLRKLPKEIVIEHNQTGTHYLPDWRAKLVFSHYSAVADNPEDAAGLLLCKLLEEGIINKEVRNG